MSGYMRIIRERFKLPDTSVTYANELYNFDCPDFSAHADHLRELLTKSDIDISSFCFTKNEVYVEFCKFICI